MNITEEKRTEIIAENNTAQREFINILKQLSKDHSDEIRFENPMHGDLDFSELKDQGYKHIHTIIFDKSGNVTNILNVPEGIKRLECSNQMLVGLSGLPESIEEINVEGNYLKKFDANELNKLRILQISNNELEDLLHLPASLEELYCDNNLLKRLDLAKATEMHTLHCSNNQLLVVANPPSTLVDFQMNDNPLTEITNDTKNASERESKMDYTEAMYNYFSLKRKYEEKMKEIKRAAYKKGDSNKNGAAKARNVKPPCVNCKRRVGTVFDMKHNRYSAVCGDKTHPCNLNIQLYTGNYFDIETVLRLYYEDLNKTKERIITHKMETLFSYVNEDTVLSKFKEELELYTSDSKIYKEVLDRHNNLYENEEKRIQISKKTQEIYDIIAEINSHMKEYEISGTRESLSSALHIQKRDLIPAIQNLRMKKWGLMEMSVSPENDASKLIQIEVPLNKSEFIYGEDPRVIKYVV